MTAALYYPAVIEYDYNVGVFDGGQPVRYHKYRSAVHERVHTTRNYRFGTRIYRACSLVQYHDGRIGDCGARYRHKLPLSLREVCAVARKHGIVALWKSRYEIVRARKLCRRHALLVGSVELAVSNILHDRAREQIGILQHDAERATQVCFFILLIFIPS